MYCSKCGNQIEKGEVFCDNCGAKKKLRKSNLAKNKRVIVLIAVVAILFVGLVLGICVIGSFTDKISNDLSDTKDFQSESQEKGRETLNGEMETENISQETEDAIIKCYEYYDAYDNSTWKVEFDKNGDFIAFSETSETGTSTTRLRWEYLQSSKKAYNEAGSLVEDIYFDENGNTILWYRYDENRLSSKLQYEYYDDGTLRSEYEQYYSENEILESDEFNKYNRNEQIIYSEYNNYYDSGEKACWIEEYNEYEELIKVKYIGTGTETTRIIEYTRNIDNRKSKGYMYHYTSDNEILEEYEIYEYEYNNNGDVVTKIQYDFDGTIWKKENYEYDANGNLLVEYTYVYEELESVEYYTYYEL